MTEEAKYPPRIERLFAARFPPPHASFLGYSPEERRTPAVTGLAKYRDHWKTYSTWSKDAAPPMKEVVKGARASRKSRHLHLKSLADERRAKRAVSVATQHLAWTNTDIGSLPHYASSEPQCTVFVLRLSYKLSESELKEKLLKFGKIVLAIIVRDHLGKSRGYAFVVFADASQAAECVDSLCRTGLTFEGHESSDWTVPACVDIERARLIRNWLPRRLGGGLGGRGFRVKKIYSSAAALGRRIAVSNGFHAGGYTSSRNERNSNDGDRYSRRNTSGDRYKSRDQSGERYAGSRGIRDSDRDLKRDNLREEVPPKYARYRSGATSSNRDQRSTRSIRDRY